MKLAHCSLGAAALAMSCCALVPKVVAAELTLPRDGWSSWEVAAVDAAPDWCCWSSTWSRGTTSAKPCRLDSDRDNYGNRDHQTTDAVRIYARTASGKVDRLRVFSASCPVEAATPIKDLGSIAEDTSARWLIGHVKQNGDDGVPALAMHRGDVARDGLAAIARTDARAETRKAALFWLAQMGAPEAESAIVASIRKEPDDEVREQAIFALSQLPDERAPRALIAVVEDRSLSREERRQALFWLAQSESAAAQAYLDRVLTAN